MKCKEGTGGEGLEVDQMASSHPVERVERPGGRFSHMGWKWHIDRPASYQKVFPGGIEPQAGLYSDAIRYPRPGFLAPVVAFIGVRR